MYGQVIEVRKLTTLHTYMEHAGLHLAQTTPIQNFSLRRFRKRNNTHNNNMRFHARVVSSVGSVTCTTSGIGPSVRNQRNVPNNQVVSYVTACRAGAIIIRAPLKAAYRSCKSTAI